MVNGGGAAVAHALHARWPDAAFTVAGVPLGNLSAGRRPLTDGAVVVVHGRAGPPPDRPAAPRPCAPAVLAVHSGPGAGLLFPLHRGTYSLGRGHCRIAIADPTLSRHHGTLAVGERGVTLSAAPGSTGFSILRGWRENPLVAAVPVKGMATIDAGDLIRCGMSGLVLALALPAAVGSGRGGSEARGCGSAPDSDDARGSADYSGLLDVAALAPVKLSGAAGPPRGRWASLAAGLVPLAAGVLLAWLTGSWMFLAMAAMAALAVIPPLLGGLGQRRAFRAGVVAASVQDAVRRLAVFPGADVLVAAALGPGPGPPEHGGPVPGPRDPGRRGKPPLDAGPGTAGMQASGRPDRHVALRVGTADQRAALEPVAGSPSFKVPLSSALPVTVELGPVPVRISGAVGPLRVLLHFVLMQLDAAAVPVVLLGPVAELPLTARFLPLTVLACSHAAAGLAIQGTATDAGFAANEASGPGPGAPATRTGAAPAAPDCVLVSFEEDPDEIRRLYPGIPSIHFAHHIAEGGAGDPDVRLHSQGNGSSARFGAVAFVPDGVPAAIFDQYARARAGSGRPALAEDPLASCCVPLPEASHPQFVADAWKVNAVGPLKPVPVGRSVTGHENFSFADDGPHLLVGGTTGSGKSEFLRTLAGSLALTHSPADLQFILIDFKGGAGLRPLQKFPHTSALITDLDGRGMDRTLASLRSEIRRREAVLNHAGTSDADAYRAGTGALGTITSVDVERGARMAHLVIIIDEFRVLVDQYPDAMTELMRIAAVGRSLGIHLVMATQRPQGAVSTDIRANVTSSVCLRVQTTFDSQDVIGSGVAAFIGVDTPGRAFISRAGGTPTEFQSATLRLPAARGHVPPVAEPAADRLRQQANRTTLALPGDEAGPQSGDGRCPASAGPEPQGSAMAHSNTDAVAGLLTAAWTMLAQPCGPTAPAACTAAPTPHSQRPPASAVDTQQDHSADSQAPPQSGSQPPQPGSQTPPTYVDTPRVRWRAAPAIVAPELPARLELSYVQVRLVSDSEAGDHAGAAGGPADRAGAGTILPGRGAGADAVLLGLVDVPERQLLEPLMWSPSTHSHVACIGTRAASSSGVGLLAAQLLAANAGRADAPPQYFYVLDGDRSMQALSRSPWVGSYVGPSDLRTAARLLQRLSERATSTEAHLAVFVSDWGRWVAAFRSSPWPWAEDSVTALVRHSRPNVAVVLGGDREVLTAPFMAALPNRLFLPFGATAESRLMWPTMPRFAPRPGRAVIFGPVNAAAAQGAPDDPHLAQLGEADGDRVAKLRQRAPDTAAPPLVVRALPDVLSLADARLAMGDADRVPGAKQASGEGLRGSNTDSDTARHSTPGTQGLPSITVGLGGDCCTPVTLRLAPGIVLPVLGGPGSGKSTFMAAVRELNGAPERILWVDDAVLLAPDQLQAVSRQVAAGSSALVAVPNHLPSLARLPLEWGLRNAEQGIVLTPRRQQDGELFGLRLDTAGSEPRGRAVLVDHGQTEWFQFPRQRNGN
ncbi:FHA domain-containing protein [Arthrobacter dokdonensis]|uniref:FHA domain-containing protein n=1 Tax=Arthrobacter dokdonellae TaxID=2211210 RepID=UPI001494AF4B|nr:FHA domain-containing protein [Arthrobacter dokdonellae]